MSYVRNQYSGASVFHIVEHDEEGDAIPPVAVCGYKSEFFPHHAWPRVWNHAWAPSITCTRCAEIREQRVTEDLNQNVDRLLRDALDPVCRCSPVSITTGDDAGNEVVLARHRLSQHVKNVCIVPQCRCLKFVDRDELDADEPLPRY